MAFGRLSPVDRSADLGVVNMRQRLPDEIAGHLGQAGADISGVATELAIDQPLHVRPILGRDPPLLPREMSASEAIPFGSLAQRAQPSTNCVRVIASVCRATTPNRRLQSASAAPCCRPPERDRLDTKAWIKR